MSHLNWLRATLRPVAHAAALSTCLAASPAWAADAANAKVVWGSGSVSTTGSTTKVNQASGAMRIDWTNMDVPSGSRLDFVQAAGRDAVTINVVTGNTPTCILGSVTAPGHVYVLNPNGVLMGAGAQISVGSWVASALAFESFDMDSGALTLKRDASRAAGNVVNQGVIVVPEGGTVALVGPQVSNAGTILAPQGSALLLAGDQVVFTPDRNGLLAYSLTRSSLAAAVGNSGTVSASGGTVVLDARSVQQAVVNTTGVIEAAGVQEGADGVIRLVALGAEGSRVTVRGAFEAGVQGEATADLTEGGELDFAPDAAMEMHAASLARELPTLDVVALDKVYDGTTDATVRLNLNALPTGGEVPTQLQITQAHFDERFVVPDESSYVHFSVGGNAAESFEVPSYLEARILPRELRVQADTKVYDGSTAAQVQVLDILDIDKGLVDVTITGAYFMQADVNPEGPVAVGWASKRIDGGMAASYKLAAEGFGLILPKELGVTAQDKVADGSRTATVSLIQSDIVARDNTAQRLQVNLSDALFDSAAASASPVGVSYSATLVGAAAANYRLSGRTSALITAAPTGGDGGQVPLLIPDGLGEAIGTTQRGPQATSLGVNPFALADLLAQLPPTAAGGEGESADAGADKDKPVQVKDGGIKLPATLPLN